MKYTNTNEVDAECTYCFEPVCGKIKISKEELEELAKKNMLDSDTNKIINHFK